MRRWLDVLKVWGLSLGPWVRAGGDRGDRVWWHMPAVPAGAVLAPEEILLCAEPHSIKALGRGCWKTPTPTQTQIPPQESPQRSRKDRLQSCRTHRMQEQAWLWISSFGQELLKSLAVPHIYFPCLNLICGQKILPELLLSLGWCLIISAQKQDCSSSERGEEARPFSG